MKKHGAKYQDMLQSVTGILSRHNPVGIANGSNTDEYEPEAKTIFPKLENCHSANDVMWMVHQQFASWFHPDTAGPREHYRAVAEEIWNFWQESQRRRR